MCPVDAPVHVARVSGELRRLLAEARRHRTHGGPVGDQDGGATAAPARMSPRRASTAPWLEAVLRRDGARPLRLRGLLLFDISRGDGAAGSRLRIFATDDDRAIVQVIYLPPETLPARPVFRVAWADSAEDVHRFLVATGPEQCFAASADVRDDVARQDICDHLRLSTCLPGRAPPRSSPPPRSKES